MWKKQQQQLYFDVSDRRSEYYTGLMEDLASRLDPSRI